MCVDVSLDENAEFLDNLKTLSMHELGHIDECSMSLLTECDPVDHETLALAVGKALVNSVLVKLLQDSVKEVQSK